MYVRHTRLKSLSVGSPTRPDGSFAASLHILFLIYNLILVHDAYHLIQLRCRHIGAVSAFPGFRSARQGQNELERRIEFSPTSGTVYYPTGTGSSTDPSGTSVTIHSGMYHTSMYQQPPKRNQKPNQNWNQNWDPYQWHYRSAKRNKHPPKRHQCPPKWHKLPP